MGKRLAHRLISCAVANSTWLTVLWGIVGIPAFASTAENVLWYHRPARDWMSEALPVGAGDLGAMVFGGTQWERLQFNEKSLWSGDETNPGSYRAFGDVFIRFQGVGPADNYRRELDLHRAIQTTTFRRDGICFQRQVIASHPAGVIAVRVTADKPGAFSGKLWLTDMHGGDILASGHRLTVTGFLGNGMDYVSQVILCRMSVGVVQVMERDASISLLKRAEAALGTAPPYIGGFSRRAIASRNWAAFSYCSLATASANCSCNVRSIWYSSRSHCLSRSSCSICSS